MLARMMQIHSMNLFKGEEDMKSKWNSRKITSIVLALVLAWTVKEHLVQNAKIKELSMDIEKENKVKSKVERDIRNLKTEIEKKDSLEFTEKVAREDYNMVKPREIIYIDKDKKTNKKSFIKPTTK